MTYKLLIHWRFNKLKRDQLVHSTELNIKRTRKEKDLYCRKLLWVVVPLPRPGGGRFKYTIKNDLIGRQIYMVELPGTAPGSIW